MTWSDCLVFLFIQEEGNCTSYSIRFFSQKNQRKKEKFIGLQSLGKERRGGKGGGNERRERRRERKRRERRRGGEGGG